MAQIHELDAIELAKAYSLGDLSPVVVTETLLERIAHWEPGVNAMCVVDREGAMAQARDAERRWRHGEPLSPLDGVPVTIKENIVSRGHPAPIGTRANEELPVPTQDSPPAARVREAGCVLLGKTTMPDYGMLSSGVSSLHGITRNPWQLDRNTSGSSSGAGAAAAARYAPLHLGTDIGGSVRLPATHCGIFGLKPSFGRVPIHPPFMARVTGPMTRTVAESALLLNVLSQPDVRDYMSLPAQGIDFATGLDTIDPGTLRIGFLPDMRLGLPVHAEVRAAAQAAADALAGAGATVEEMSPFLTPEMLDGSCRFFEARLHNDFVAMSKQRQDKVLPFVAEWCTWRAGGFTGAGVMTAFNRILAMREATVAACARYDFVISPTSPILPYEAELPCPGNDPHDALPHIAFTLPYNFSEQPAASINWTASQSGLPIGVQVIGQRFDDAGVLRVCRLLETLRPPQRDWPEIA